MNFSISDDAKAILRTAGWNEQYYVDVQEIKTFLEGHGFSVTPIAREFLSTFHGVKLRLPNRSGLSFVHFDVYEEMGWIEEQDKPFLNALAQAPLCPVGHGGGFLLFLIPTGEVILLSDQWLTFSRLCNIADAMDLILGIRKPASCGGGDLTREQVPLEFR